MTPHATDTARAFVEPAVAGDRDSVAALAAPDAEWTTPRGNTYDAAEIAVDVAAPEDEDVLAVAREGHRYHEVAPGRVLVQYDTVYRWKDEDALENTVPSAYVVDVRDDKVVRVQAFLDAEKAEDAARAEDGV